MAYTTIREGSRGEDVKRLQTLLNNEEMCIRDRSYTPEGAL